MRPEFDSEIDSVLRGHARRGGAPSSAWDEGVRQSISARAAAGAHLDADEIAAFGEGALPAAARARYAAHLADCDDCRRSVTQVALAAGHPDSVEERERAGVAAAAATQSPSWRERLAAVFAPRAWRYAMPVVALVAVSAVVLVVTRRLPREGALVTTESRRADAPQQASAPAAAPDSHHADAMQQREPAEQTGTQSGNAATTADVPSADEDRESGAAGEIAKLGPKRVDGVGQSAVGGAGGTGGAQPEVARQAQAEPAPPTESFMAAATPSPVPLPPAAAPAPRPMVLRDAVPQPTPATENVQVARRESDRGDSRDAVTRDAAPATKRHGPQRGAGTALSSSEASKDGRVASRARGPQNNAQNNAAGANRSEAGEAKAGRKEEREQQAETRSVGGRRFRREGGVWIDTAYRPGQAAVVVRAGSEQYRALVADEPEIGRISRALGGEAVIVWKGRAYRVKP